MILNRNKPIIVTVHGFGKNISHEFDPFTQYFKKKRYDVVQFDMYNLNDPDDIHYKDWIARAEKVMLEVQKKNRPIILLGFSMGGVIASYLASIFPVKMLILCAPAFQYLDLPKITAQGVKLIKNFGKGAEKTVDAKRTRAFTEIVSNYKASIDQVDCPVLFIHGTNDEIIPVESSRDAYKNLEGKKRMILLEGAKHRFLYDGIMEKTAFTIIEQAIKGNLFD